MLGCVGTQNLHDNSSDVFGCGYRVLWFVSELAAKMMLAVLNIVRILYNTLHYQPRWTVREASEAAIN